MATVPLAVNILFIAATIFACWQFFLASNKSKTFMVVILIATIVEAVLSLNGFYERTVLPPGFLFAIIPVPVAAVYGIFLVKQPGLFRMRNMMMIHAVRVPVEICLFSAYRYSLVPIEMTFEGYNFDILSGISAIVLLLTGIFKNHGGKKILLVWNFLALLLLINILLIAAFSAPTPFQQLGIDQPNRLVALFPFIWLPGIVVPLVLLSHIIAIRHLLQRSGDADRKG